jgi:hypothetical protein
MVPRFTPDDAQRAWEAWGCNCGPTALAAMTDRTLEEVRPHLQGFDAKRYMNPTMMFDALESLGVPFRRVGTEWPRYGLARIQWEGPWTEPGVPMKARYRYTHWVAGWHAGPKGYGVFDVNAMATGSGWSRREVWERQIVPWILREAVPRANGRWHVTHGIEVCDPAGVVH